MSMKTVTVVAAVASVMLSGCVTLVEEYRTLDQRILQEQRDRQCKFSRFEIKATHNKLREMGSYYSDDRYIVTREHNRVNTQKRMINDARDKIKHLTELCEGFIPVARRGDPE